MDIIVKFYHIIYTKIYRNGLYYNYQYINTK